jgi:hypothetical protein
MNIVTGMRRLVALSALVLLSACTPSGNRPEFVGELGVAGPNVFVNNVAAKPGTWINAGDSVTTGPGSSAMIVFASGGFFQLDANTDPFFSWATVEGARCVLVRIFRGQGYVQGGSTCISSPASDALAQSAVNMVVSDQTSVFTLLDGHLKVSRPGPATLMPGQEVRVGPRNAVPQVRTLTPDELHARVQWRSNYQFVGWCGSAGAAVQTPVDRCAGQFSFSPRSAAAPGVGFGFGFGGGDRDRPSVPRGRAQ